jgi:hypothetical protein
MLTSLHKEYQIVKQSPPLAGVLKNLWNNFDNYSVVFEQKIKENPSCCSITWSFDVLSRHSGWNFYRNRGHIDIEYQVTRKLVSTQLWALKPPPRGRRQTATPYTRLRSYRVWGHGHATVWTCKQGHPPGCTPMSAAIWGSADLCACGLCLFSGALH